MRSRAGPAAQRLEQMREAERVDGERLDRLGDRAAHQRLGGEVQHDLRVGRRDRRAHRVADRADRRGAKSRSRPTSARSNSAGVCVGREREAGDVGAEPLEPQRRPAALEAGVAGEQHPAAAPELGAGQRRVHAHIFHGARPEAQWLSSWFLSRNVSIGCQKPAWR